MCLPLILLILNKDVILMLKPFLLLFSGNVSYQTSNNLRSVSQKLAHNQHKQKPNKTEYNRRTKLSCEIDTAKLAEPFIPSHLLRSLERQSID